MILVSMVDATEVSICMFRGGPLFGFADNEIDCSGAVQKTHKKVTTTIQDMYNNGWEYKGSYTMKDYTYVVLEKNSK